MWLLSSTHNNMGFYYDVPAGEGGQGSASLLPNKPKCSFEAPYPSLHQNPDFRDPDVLGIALAPWICYLDWMGAQWRRQQLKQALYDVSQLPAFMAGSRWPIPEDLQRWSRGGARSLWST